MKVCSECKLEKDESEFNKNRGKPSVWCKTCLKIYHHKRNSTTEMRKKRMESNYKKRNAVRIKVMEYLNSNPCVQCGENDIVVLEFDHLRDKKFAIAEGVSGGYAWKTIEKEIEKCRVLCANCHRRHTAESRGWFKTL